MNSIVIKLTEEQAQNLQARPLGESIKYLYREVVGWDGIRWFNNYDVEASEYIHQLILAGERDTNLGSYVDQGPRMDRKLAPYQLRLNGSAAKYYQEQMEVQRAEH